jgi:hypothetical protein
MKKKDIKVFYYFIKNYGFISYKKLNEKKYFFIKIQKRLDYFINLKIFFSCFFFFFFLKI